jgi:tetratricopeptide (TPR) repeat protein
MNDDSPTRRVEDEVRRRWDEAQAHVLGERFPQALAALGACRALLEPTNLLRSQYTVCFEIGRLHEELGRFPAAHSAYQAALSRAETLNDSPLLASVCHRLGQVERLAGATSQAKKWFEKATAHAEATGDRRGAALSRAMLGQIICTEGDMTTGLRQMLAALLALPADAPEHGHLVEHTAYLGTRVDEAAFSNLLDQTTADAALRLRLLGQRSTKLPAPSRLVTEFLQ